MGTITVTASPGIAAQNYVLNPFGLGTAENSNMPYDLVPSGSSRSIAQPFGVIPWVPRLPPHGPAEGLQPTVIILDRVALSRLSPTTKPGLRW
jgi:hypothetical protein